MKNFKDLLVWQKAVDLVTFVYNVTKESPDEKRYGITSQMRRSAVSIPSNIVPIFTNLKNWIKIEDPRFCNQIKNLNKIGAEGHMRTTDKDFRQLYRFPEVPAPNWRREPPLLIS